MASSSHNSQLLLLFIFLIASALPVLARESRFFSKAIPYQQPNQPQVEELFTPSSDFNETNPLSAFMETSSPSQKQNGHGLYGQEPQQFPPTATTNSTISTDRENQPTTVNYSSFETEDNLYGENFESKDFKSGFSRSAMGDGRFPDNEKYFYDVQNEHDQNGFRYQREGDGARYGRPYRGTSPIVDENRYGGYASENAYYETNNYDWQGNQEEKDEFIP